MPSKRPILAARKLAGEIAEMLGHHESVGHEYVRALQDAGLIRKGRGGGAGAFDASAYEGALIGVAIALHNSPARTVMRLKMLSVPPLKDAA